MKFRILRYASSFFFLVMSYTYFLFEPWGSETLVLWSKETSVTSFPKNWEKGAGKSPVNFWHLLDPFSLIQKTDSTSLRKRQGVYSCESVKNKGLNLKLYLFCNLFNKRLTRDVRFSIYVISRAVLRLKAF